MPGGAHLTAQIWVFATATVTPLAIGVGKASVISVLELKKVGSFI